MTVNAMGRFPLSLMQKVFVLLAWGSPLAEGAFLGSDSMKTKTTMMQVGHKGIAKLILSRREEPEPLPEHIANPKISKQVPDWVGRHFGPIPSNASPQEKYPFIFGCHDALESIFAKRAESWFMDWKLWLGAAIWLGVWYKWLKYGHGEIFYVQAVFTFGINIVILHHLQYAETVKWGMLLICSLLCVQACFQSYMWSKSELAGDAAELAADATGGEVLPCQSSKTMYLEQGNFECETMYLDLALPIEQVCVLFMAQLCVSWFYMTYILANFDIDSVNYTFWMVAYLTMQMTMIFCRGADSALGKAFPSHDVYNLWVNCDQISFQLLEAGDAVSPRRKAFKISRANVLFRGVAGFFCNAILREILAYTIPLMLMSFADPMDFVVYCIGVNFICTVDDTKDRTYKKIYDDQDCENLEAGTGEK